MSVHKINVLFYLILNIYIYNIGQKILIFKHLVDNMFMEKEIQACG